MAPEKAYFEGGASRSWAKFLAGIQKEEKHTPLLLFNGTRACKPARPPQVARAFEAVNELLNELLTTETQRSPWPQPE
jgi:hypothetical protein